MGSRRSHHGHFGYVGEGSEPSISELLAMCHVLDRLRTTSEPVTDIQHPAMGPDWVFGVNGQQVAMEVTSVADHWTHYTAIPVTEDVPLPEAYGDQRCPERHCLVWNRESHRRRDCPQLVKGDALTLASYNKRHFPEEDWIISPSYTGPNPGEKGLVQVLAEQLRDKFDASQFDKLPAGFGNAERWIYLTLANHGKATREAQDKFFVTRGVWIDPETLESAGPFAYIKDLSFEELLDLPETENFDEIWIDAGVQGSGHGRLLHRLRVPDRTGESFASVHQYRFEFCKDLEHHRPYRCGRSIGVTLR